MCAAPVIKDAARLGADARLPFVAPLSQQNGQHKGRATGCTNCSAVTEINNR